MLLMVNHTPLLYSPKHFSVMGTNVNTTIADHPLMMNEKATFFIIRDERLSVVSFINAGYYRLSSPSVKMSMQAIHLAEETKLIRILPYNWGVKA
jgi:hypothetical protein